MRIIEVTDKKLAQAWLDVPKKLYRNDKNWICPLDIEIEGIFNPQNNTCFQNGKAIRWILSDNDNNLIGRIAAFIDFKKVDHYRHPTGGAGFFECTDDQSAANLLFDTAKNWLKENGMQAMLAPVNFGENYNYWGLLVEGYTSQGYGMPYNFPYYQKLIENYGFREFFGQFTFHKRLADGWPDRMLKFAEYTATRPGYTFEHFSYDRIDKYINDFVFTYNNIWSHYHDGYTPLQASEIRKLVEDARLVIQEEFIWFVYDNGKPAGLMVAFPDVNQILAKLKNGKLNLINKLKFFWWRRRAITRTRVFIFGILPEYQNSGIIAALFLQLVKVLDKKKRFDEIELSWVGDYNPKMIAVYEKIGAVKAKKHATYIHIFGPEEEYYRFDNTFDGKLYVSKNEPGG